MGAWPGMAQKEGPGRSRGLALGTLGKSEEPKTSGKPTTDFLSQSFWVFSWSCSGKCAALGWF